jgi:hypothetical protein
MIEAATAEADHGNPNPVSGGRATLACDGNGKTQGAGSERTTIAARWHKHLRLEALEPGV